MSLAAIGNENAAGFTVLFDSANLKYVSAALGGGASGATMNVNTNQAAAGRIGVALALSTGGHFAAQTNELVKLTFQAVPSVSGSFPISLGIRWFIGKWRMPGRTPWCRALRSWDAQCDWVAGSADYARRPGCEVELDVDVGEFRATAE